MYWKLYLISHLLGISLCKHFHIMYLFVCVFFFTAYYLLLALFLGCYGEQQGGGACSGSDGWRRRRGGQVMCRMWRSNRRPLPALLHGTVLAHAVPQVLLLPCSARRVQQHLLQQRRHDPLQE